MFERKVVAVQDHSGQMRALRVHLYWQRDGRVQALSPDVLDLTLVGSSLDAGDLVEQFQGLAAGFEWITEDW